MRKFICIIAWLGILSGTIHGQCLTNGDFAAGCSGVDNNCNNSWSDACGAGWVRSQGTPRMVAVTGEGGSVSHYVFMSTISQANAVYTDGIFTPYSFQANRTYKLKITYLFTGNPATLNIYAANGLVKDASCSLTIPPTIPSKQAINVSTMNGSSTTSVATFTFTPTSNYAQLWIYPRIVESTINLLNGDFYLYSVQLCPSCDDVINLNTGTVSAGTTEAGYINVGSSVGTGGSGTVFIDAVHSTSLIAKQQVLLAPSFQATPSLGGAFSATINPCDPSQVINSTPGRSDSLGMHALAGSNGQDAHPPAGTSKGLFSVKVYPSIGSGVVHISGSQADISGVDIQVIDEAGRGVYRSRPSGNTLITLDLTGLMNGVYFIRLRNGNGSTVQKIIISR